MKPFTGLLLITSLLSLLSTSAQALDLIQTLELAKQQDAQLRIARSQLDSARLTLPQAQSANRPQVNLPQPLISTYSARFL